MAVDGKKIRMFRKENELTQEELGKKLGVIKQTVSNWENNISEPNSELLSNMASIFNVPIGHLYENDGFAGTLIEHSEEKKAFKFFNFFRTWPECRERILKKISNLGISKSDLQENLEINLDTEITIDDLVKIAIYLDVSTDYLLGVTKIDAVSPQDISLAQSLSDRERNFLDAFRKLNEDDKDIIIGDTKKYLKEQRRSSVAADDPAKKTGTSNTGN